MTCYLYLLIAIIAEVIATTALKASHAFTRPLPSILVILGYGCAFYFLSLAIKKMSVGVAYAIWSGIGIVLITLLSMVLYQEKPDFAAIVGGALIVAGVIVLTGFSNLAIH